VCFRHAVGQGVRSEQLGLDDFLAIQGEAREAADTTVLDDWLDRALIITSTEDLFG
jgi:hypothetical protein